MALEPPDRIATERLLLRRPSLSDAPAIFQRYATDGEVTRFLSWRPHHDQEETRAFLELCLEGWDAGSKHNFVIARKDRPEQALGMIDMRRKGHVVEFGYVLARSEWGRGFMPEALGGLVALALDQPPIWRVQALCDAENLASARVMEKAGLSFEGRLRRYLVHPNIDPAPRDSFLYARTRED